MCGVRNYSNVVVVRTGANPRIALGLDANVGTIQEDKTSSGSDDHQIDKGETCKRCKNTKSKSKLEN